MVIIIGIGMAIILLLLLKWLSFVAVIVYKVAMNTELAILNHCSWGKYRFRILQALAGNIFVNKSKHNLVLCVSLLEDTLLNIIVETLALDSQPAAL